MTPLLSRTKLFIELEPKWAKMQSSGNKSNELVSLNFRRMNLYLVTRAMAVLMLSGIMPVCEAQSPAENQQAIGAANGLQIDGASGSTGYSLNLQTLSFADSAKMGGEAYTWASVSFGFAHQNVSHTLRIHYTPAYSGTFQTANLHSLNHNLNFEFTQEAEAPVDVLPARIWRRQHVAAVPVQSGQFIAVSQQWDFRSVCGHDCWSPHGSAGHQDIVTKQLLWNSSVVVRIRDRHHLQIFATIQYFSRGRILSIAEQAR